MYIDFSNSNQLITQKNDLLKIDSISHSIII